MLISCFYFQVLRIHCYTSQPRVVADDARLNPTVQKGYITIPEDTLIKFRLVKGHTQRKVFLLPSIHPSIHPSFRPSVRSYEVTCWVLRTLDNITVISIHSISIVDTLNVVLCIFGQKITKEIPKKCALVGLPIRLSVHKVHPRL